MSNTLDLTKLTIEEVKVLLANGMLIKDLLVAVVNMPTTKYSSDTGIHEPIPELIAKQSELVQLCLTNGVKLKDVFENIYKIPESFIEHNLPLIIESQYDPTKVLEHISMNLQLFNDALNLITKLIRDHNADIHKLYSIPPDLDVNSIEFLLSKGMEVEVLLKAAFWHSNKGKQKELFELAFRHGANTTSFKHLDVSVENCNEDIFKFLMDNEHNVLPQDLLNMVVNAKTDKYNQATKKPEQNQELIAKQSNLTNFLISQGADPTVVQIDSLRMNANTLFRHAGLIIEKDSSLGYPTLDVLLSRSYILPKESVSKEYTDKITACYQDLLKSPESKKILDFLAFKISNGDELKVIFAIMPNDDASRYDHYNNYVFIDLNTLDYLNNSLAAATIHEFAHCVMNKLFANDLLPYLAIQENYPEQVKKDLEQQHQEYAKAAADPMKLALQMISRAENGKTEIDSSEEFAVYLKTQTLLPLWYLKDYHDTAQLEDLKEAALTVIKILYTDIEVRNKHVIAISQGPTTELEHLKNVTFNLEKDLNISKSQSIFLTRLADEVCRPDKKDMEIEHIVRYMEFLAQHNEGRLEDPRIIKSYSKLQEYWNKYIFPEMDKIMRSSSSVDQRLDHTHEDEVSISGGSSISVGTE